MSGLFSSFNVVKRALGASQYALNTTSHNIANANTEGYTRQRVTMVASAPMDGNISGPGQIGTGVDIREVTRIRNSFLDDQLRNQLGILGNFEARDEFLANVEVIMMEPTENGISTAMGEMWDSWQELSSHPESSNARTLVVEASETLAHQIRNTYSQLESLQKDCDKQVKLSVDEFNSIIRSIDDLNRQIASVTISGGAPNDLLDRRDLLLDQLSKIADIKTENGQLGRINIAIGNKTILSDSAKLELQINGSVLKWSDDSAAEFNQGKIQGYLSVKDEIDNYMGRLDNLAKVIAVSVNTIHNDGADEDNYVPFFTAGKDLNFDPDSVNASNISVNYELKNDLNRIHAELDYNNEDPNYHNGQRALQIARLRDVRFNVDKVSGDLTIEKSGDSVIIKAGDYEFIKYDNANMTMENDNSGTTIDDYFQDIIGVLGSSSKEAKGMVVSQEALISQIETRRDSISGVSMDEEMANMIQYQRTYQAAARFITVIDELLDNIINRMAV